MKTIKLSNLLETPASRRDVVDGYPHLSLFLSEMRELIVQSGDAALSLFQLGNSSADKRPVTCPVAGKPCIPNRSIVTRDKTVFLQYVGERTFWLAVSNMGRGYPPSALYYPDSDTLIKFDDPVWGVRDYQLIELKQILEDNVLEPAIDATPGSNVLITGDQNYAHVLWNQLPALFAFVRDPAFSDAKIVVTHESLGPLDLLVPGLDPNRLIRVSPYMLLNEVNRSEAWFNTPGSLKISDEVLSAVKTTCKNLASEKAREVAGFLESSDSPVVWLSLRAHDRTATNQLEYLEELIVAMFEVYDHLNVVLDGFSTPYDLDRNFDYPDFNAVAAQTLEMAESLVARVNGRLAADPSKRIFNTCGLSVPDSLHLATFANFYVCHHGTVQHKVGWMSNCFGLVHSNTAIVDGKPETWAGSMIEAGTAPAYVKKGFIVDADDGAAEDDRTRDLRLGNYTFQNIPKLVTLTLDYLDQALHKTY